MSRRSKILFGTGVVLGLAILIPVIRHYQLRFAVEKYVAELKAQGEPMELAQVIPLPTSPEQNGVAFITNAIGKLKYESIAGSNTPPAMDMVAPGKAMVGWQQPDIRNIQWATNTWEDLDRELTAASSDLNSFQSLSSHPVLDFNLDYQKGFDLLLPHLAPLKRSAQWLSASALYDLHKGNLKGACADVRAILAIVKGETDERTIISQLVRIAIAAIGVSATWEILQSPNVTDADLAQLQQDWQSLDFNHALEQSFVYERAEHLPEYGQIRESTDRFNKFWGYFYTSDAGYPNQDEGFLPLKKRSSILRKWDEFRWRWFWSYQDEVRGMKAYRVVIEATRLVETNRSFQIVASFVDSNLSRINQEQGSWDDLRNAFTQSTFSSSAALRKSVRIETARNIAVIAIALKRYELRHHQLPVALGELTPDLLNSVPVDCMNGQPLHYRLNANGMFLLYSVGPNGKDDGGDPSLEKGIPSSNFYWQNDHALDWVWPQPATAEEIQKYYEEQGKKSGH